ncbi:hypothetical protein M2283_001969 [Streptomyces pseudovenezuelae]|uniref:Uncharacterized protein n=1 Tax=Streptomyces pseudovenezuelae TaxID=67350 RepID=A0ABT6LED9_9ACTN|nr:hypothetical protein [Streptomyces pseudovenezuelae]
MNTGHPRDVDPSITGQPHQATGEVPDLMGNITRTLGNPVNMPAAVRILVPPQLLSGNSADPEGSGKRQAFYAAPRCNASHTAVDSRAPSSVALPQWAIQAPIPSGVPETYPSSAAR